MVSAQRKTDARSNEVIAILHCRDTHRYARAGSPLSPPPEERPRRAMCRQSALVRASAHVPRRPALYISASRLAGSVNARAAALWKRITARALTEPASRLALM